MAHRHPPQLETTVEEPLASRGRHPYKAPRILHRELLEAMASDCSIPGGKADASCVLGFS